MASATTGAPSSPPRRSTATRAMGEPDRVRTVQKRDRFAYVPHVGQAVCEGRFSLQRAQVTRVGALAFHCERRLRVLERDILRLGTATVLP